VSDDDSLAERYEEIRGTLFDRHQTVMMWGLVVLRTKGMAAWARSWREHGVGGAKPARSKSSGSIAASPIPPNSEEVVRVLAAMLWGIQEEAVS